MKTNHKYFIFTAIAGIVFFGSCSTFDKASVHGFNSGYYKMNLEKKEKTVYVHVKEEEIEVYKTEKNVDDNGFIYVPVILSDSLLKTPLQFKKQGLDIDITGVPLKFRASVYGLPSQLTSEFNAALYAGWRHDNYKIVRKTDPLGNRFDKIINRGYDIGFFAGPGITQISPFSTQNIGVNEYSGMIMQAGIAGFLETDLASFGMAVGYDYLLNRDRNIWIYHNKPWFGLIVGIALN